MSSGLRQLYLLAAISIVGVFVMMTEQSCAGTQRRDTKNVDVVLYTALDTLSDSVNATSALSKETCVALQDAQNAAARAGSKTADQAKEEIDRIDRRCQEIRGVFERIGQLQNEAVDLVQSDAIEEAKARLEEAQRLWNRLKDEGVTP